MPSGSGAALSPAGISGRIAGATLGACRKSASLTQEAFAERLRVSLATIQGWESGRKPLARVPFTRLRAIRRELAASGADAARLALLDKALDADVIWAELGTPSPDRHPLALTVPDRVMTGLLAWPLTGEPPRQLANGRNVVLAGRGEVAAVAAGLRDAAEQGSPDEEKPAMLRRQAAFLLSQADDGAARQWAADAERRNLRAPGNLAEWTPRWPVARSAAIAAASAGDLDPLRRFIREGLGSDGLIAANLNYWAYWAGEHAADWDGDSAMTGSVGAWSGHQLLRSLLDGVTGAPYRDLCAVTLSALVRARPGLIAAGPEITQAVTSALDGARLDASSRRHLEQVLNLMETQ